MQIRNHAYFCIRLHHLCLEVLQQVYSGLRKLCMRLNGKQPVENLPLNHKADGFSLRRLPATGIIVKIF